VATGALDFDKWRIYKHIALRTPLLHDIYIRPNWKQSNFGCYTQANHAIVRAWRKFRLILFPWINWRNYCYFVLSMLSQVNISTYGIEKVYTATVHNLMKGMYWNTQSYGRLIMRERPNLTNSSLVILLYTLPLEVGIPSWLQRRVLFICTKLWVGDLKITRIKKVAPILWPLSFPITYVHSFPTWSRTMVGNHSKVCSVTL